MVPLETGDRAPDFTLPTASDETVSLSEMLQQHSYVVVIFVPAAWSPVCSDELLVLEAVADEIRRLGAGIIAISADNYWSTRAWADSLGVSFPLASDFEPKGEVSRQWDAFHEAGVCQRAHFIVDSDRRIVFDYQGPIEKTPGVHHILKKLEELSAGE